MENWRQRLPHISVSQGCMTLQIPPEDRYDIEYCSFHTEEYTTNNCPPSPFPLISGSFVENLDNCVFITASWRLKRSFPSQLNQRQLLFAKHLAHIFVQDLIINGERCAFEDTCGYRKCCVGPDIWQSWASEGMLWLEGPIPDSSFCLIYDLEVK